MKNLSLLFILFSIPCFAQTTIDELENRLGELSKFERKELPADELLQGIDNSLEFTSTGTDQEIAQAYLIASGYAGLYSKKKKSGEYGKIANDYLKLAVETDMNHNTLKAYGTALKSYCEQNMIAKPFIQMALKIDISDSAQDFVQLYKKYKASNKTSSDLEEINRTLQDC